MGEALGSSPSPQNKSKSFPESPSLRWLPLQTQSRGALGCFGVAPCSWDLLWGRSGGALAFGEQGCHTEVHPALPSPSSALPHPGHSGSAGTAVQDPAAWLPPTPVTQQCGRQGGDAHEQNPAPETQHSTQHIPLMREQGSAAELPGPWQAVWLSQAGFGYRGSGMAVGI